MNWFFQICWMCVIVLHMGTMANGDFEGGIRGFLTTISLLILMIAARKEKD